VGSLAQCPTRLSPVPLDHRPAGGVSTIEADEGPPSNAHASQRNGPVPASEHWTLTWVSRAAAWLAARACRTVVVGSWAEHRLVRVSIHLGQVDAAERWVRVVFDGEFDDVYGAKVSRDTISRITDNVIGEMNEWANRPLDRGF